MDRAKQFLFKCRSMLESDSNLIWVAFQSNLLVDLSNVEDSFITAFKDAKKTLSTKGWILPTLDANMRNQKNISNLNIKQGRYGNSKMQSSITKLGSGSSVVGEVPTLFKVQLSDWHQKKEAVLEHCIKEMEKKNNKNIVILHDGTSKFKDIEHTIKRIISNKTIVSYPSICKDKQKSIDNVISFSEQMNHILITKDKYFNGCESANLIYLTYNTSVGVRNSLMRAVENVIYVQLTGGRETENSGYYPEIEGMKIDNRFK